MQNEYEAMSTELKKEFKVKEENLKKRYENIGTDTSKRLKETENEHVEKIEKLNYTIKDVNRLNEKLEKEIEVYKEKLVSSERFFATREQEFEEIIEAKDRKLKELEVCIKQISEEANSQIVKLSQSVSEFSEKINYYKQRETQISLDYNELQNKYNQLSASNQRLEQAEQRKLDMSYNIDSKSRSRTSLITVDINVRF